jgi:uncharacterized protein YbaR (Trm112 family)
MRHLSEQLTRLQSIEPFLRCPQCGGKLKRLGNEAYQSEQCGAQYPIDHGVPILLPPSLAAQGLGKPLPPDQHASTHPYSPSSEALIHKFDTGLILDLGAGGKHIERPNVIQVDVFRFPMVDVVASADALPFRADSFDAVISQAVFEHLQYPEAAAAEIWRTLKPNGIAKIDTAFLQPEHAYPHHYFNATEAGLKHWFRDFDLQSSGVEAYQHPKWALVWFLSVYFAGLHDEDRRTLEALSLGDCIAILSRASKGETQEPDLPFLHALDGLIPDSIRKLAAGVSVQAVKQPGIAAIRRGNHQTNVAQLELERRLQAQVQVIQQQHEYNKKRAEVDLITSDRTRFLLHEYELFSKGPVVNTELLRRLTTIWMVQKIRQYLPNTWWRQLQQLYRNCVKTHESPSPPAHEARVTFLIEPRTPVELLNQFFSLTHQTHGDWAYWIQMPVHASASMKRLGNELTRLDARVSLVHENVIRAQADAATVRLQPEVVLAFDAVEELITMLHHHPRVRYITADAEKWQASADDSLRCWMQMPESSDLIADQTLWMVNGSATSRSNANVNADVSTPLKSHAHIPKVLYRLMPLAKPSLFT